MGAGVAIVTDSTSDLPPERAAELGIHVMPLTVRIDDAEYEDGTELTPAAFYEKLRTARAIPTTSQPAVGRFQALYESIDAEAIVSIHISGKLSGTVNSARAAATQVRDKRIEVVDSENVSLSMGYLAQAAAEAALSGASVEKVLEMVARQRGASGFYALLDTLEHARRSGRISFAQALLGSMLQIKPIVTIRGGVVEPSDRPRTMRKGMERLAELTRQEAPFAYLAVPHANNEPLARDLAERLADVFPGDIDVLPTGATVGSHCGPGAVATCYVKKLK
ncbi:MAG: DegV family protein [Chloroflexi bacterium]|nr:DegV family protein [Chloroflexota bacterium]